LRTECRAEQDFSRQSGENAATKQERGGSTVPSHSSQGLSPLPDDILLRPAFPALSGAVRFAILMNQAIQDSTILISGGTGSFGKTMATHLLQQGCREIRVFSRDEWKQDAMRADFPDPRLKFYLGDVRSRPSVDDAMAGVDMVFHAAALKQVPSCEFFPMQAVLTNIIGSANVLDSAVAHGVQSVVCLSTDKAVFPVNAMGMSKALMEKVALAKARAGGSENTLISSVRYGNVMYSRGSVIPLFVKQIREGKPLTVTDPRMTRFLLPLREAVRLVEFAWQNAEQGDLFVRKAPACTVGDLAEAVRQLFEVDAPVEAIGIRHGEKMFEALASAEELRRSEDMGEFMRVSMDGRDLNYNKYFSEGEVDESAYTDYTSDNTERLDLEGTKQLLLELPEIHAEIASWRASR
jgi:UDP-N-acetylglucosamine 4,6-dehydratase/5-epimerase